MIIRKLPLLIFALSVFCISCSEDSTSPTKEENIITKSKTKPEHYIPLDAENKYKYVLYTRYIDKSNYDVTILRNVVDVSVLSGQHFTLNYAIDTTLTNYFGQDKYFQNWTKTSSVFISIDSNMKSFAFEIDNNGFVSKSIFVDSTYTDTVQIADAVYPCIAIVEKRDAGMGQCTTYFAKGIGAVKYRYQYEDNERIKLSDMILMSCEVK